MFARRRTEWTNYQSRNTSLPAIAKIGRVPTLKVLEEFAPILGFAFPASTSQVFELVAPTFGLSSIPVQIHVFELDAPTFGRISLPSNTQVLELDAPDFGFNSRPSHAHSLGKSIEFVISFLKFFGFITLNLVEYLQRFSESQLHDSHRRHLAHSTVWLTIPSSLT